MDNPRLILLRWKIQLHAWLEAFWENRWSGITLTGIGAVVCAFFVWRPPEPGVSVAVMGVAAALMTARTKATGAEKAVWMLLISSLLVIEVLAIRKDRRDHDEQLARILREEVSARAEAKTNFSGIGDGINAQSRQSQQQFERTVQQQSTQFGATMKKAQMSIDEVTGGDSYVNVFPDLRPDKSTFPPDKNTFPLYVSLCGKCKYSVPNAYIYFQTDVTSNDAGQLIFHEAIDPAIAMRIQATITPAVTGETTYKITVLARNKPTTEMLKLRFNAALKQWEFSWHIERTERNPHFNPKTNMAEGTVFKVLEDVPWKTGGTTPINPAKTTVIR